MSRSLAVCALVTSLSLLANLSLGADATASPDVGEMREALDRQSKQIDVLTQQISKLTQLLESQKTAPSSAPITVPETAKPAEPGPENFRPEAIPKAEAVPIPGKHVVAKGETLTSIAKHYNIAISDLQKLNKIENDRKLQIGQTLTIPPVKSPDTAAEKKENP